MISQSQAVDSARRALSLCVSLLSRSPDSVTTDASSEYYSVVWDSAYDVLVSKKTGAVRRITTSRKPIAVVRQQHAPIARIKTDADFAAWQGLAARLFQIPRDAVTVLSEVRVTEGEVNLRLVPFTKNWPLPFFNVEPGLRINITQTLEGPQIDARNEWRYDFGHWTKPCCWCISLPAKWRFR